MDKQQCPLFFRITLFLFCFFALQSSWMMALASEEFPLVKDGVAATLLTDALDYKVVPIAAAALAGDIELVSGIKPNVITSSEPAGSNVVIIGTLEKNSLIKRLIADKKIDVSGIEGKWETYLIANVKNPFPGVASALVVAGSDRRAAAFGAFEVSRRIGVSPWVWWADVLPEKKNTLIIPANAQTFGPPSVKYRGIFLNDEDFGLKPWAAKTFEPETGDIGPKTYARIFELLLRLNANLIWPAMHNCTKAFNYYDADKYVADDYAIVMGSSHCEQMLRNNVDEWDSETYGRWSYLNNKDNLLRYWDERVQENGRFENVYTIGMRAIHDSGMPDGDTTEERVRILTDIIADQRAMLARHVNPDVTQIPQIFIPYKEVLEVYWGGLKVPDDVTLVWPDDNFGYIRRLSTSDEQKRAGGAGVYYHISYWGPPHDYLWLNTTPPALIWEEMSKAYAYNARTLWVVNVGDIKPGEIGMELFLEMGWDINRWSLNNIGRFLPEWAARDFGPEHANEIADIMARYYQLNYQRKPEHMGFYDKYSILAQNQDPEFSLFSYGDETQKRIDAFDAIERRAAAIFEKLPSDKKDAFFQLVLYPVRASSLLNKKHLYALKNRKYAKQNRVSANQYAQWTIDAFKNLKRDTAYYNETMSSGKWNLFMDDSPNDLPVFDKVSIGTMKPGESAGLGVQIEGLSKPLDPDMDSSHSPTATLPGFNRFTERSYYIDVFNKGSEPLEWSATPDAAWIKLSRSSGTTETEERIAVQIDYGLAPAGDNITGAIRISGAGTTFSVGVGVFNPAGVDIGESSFAQDNGIIAINAGSYDSVEEADGAGWRVVPGLGRTGNAMMISPHTAPGVDNSSNARGMAPVAVYSIYVFEPGDTEVILQAVPTHEIHSGRHLILGISVDDEEIIPIEFVQAHQESDEIGKQNVLRNMMEGTGTIHFESGPHKLGLWGMDPSVMPDRIIINFGGLKKSYLGPDETKIVNR